MSNAANNVQFVDSFLVSPSSGSLVVSNLQIPGGKVNGFGLFKIGGASAGNRVILYAYANQTLANNGNFAFGYYDSDTGWIYTDDTTVYSANGFEYDSANQTLTLTPQNIMSPSVNFYGTYVLLIW